MFRFLDDVKHVRIGNQGQGHGTKNAAKRNDVGGVGAYSPDTLKRMRFSVIVFKAIIKLN